MWVNDEQTLWVDRNRDTWQLPVISCDGVYCGNVVAQVVDPKQCLVRYFIIYSHNEEKHYLLPSDCVARIDTEVQCEHLAVYLRELPTISRWIPAAIGKAIQQDPSSFLQDFEP